MKKGFTLLETVIALGILIAGTLIIYSATSRVLSQSQEEKTKFVASYLAQEGIEVVRNLRDTNWVSGAADWKEGLSAGNYLVQYNSSALLAYQNIPLKIDGSHLYNYSSGTDTSFYRKITLSSPSADILKVVAEISWSGESSPLTAEEFLYNWY
jgi:type II secretory pathway pseudopilin PulG